MKSIFLKKIPQMKNFIFQCRNFCLKKNYFFALYGVQTFWWTLHPPPSPLSFLDIWHFLKFWTQNDLKILLTFRNFCTHRPNEGRWQKFLTIFSKYYACLTFWSFFQKNPSSSRADHGGKGRQVARICSYFKLLLRTKNGVKIKTKFF